MKSVLPITLLLFCAIIFAQEILPISESKSISTCKTGNRITYIYPDPNGWIDVSIGVASIDATSIYHVSGERYSLTNKTANPLWALNGRFIGEAEYRIEIAGHPEMTRVYRVTDDKRPVCDLNQDGKINLKDFEIMAKQWKK